MPYIPQDERDEIAKPIQDLPPLTEGQLNYAIQQLCMKYMAGQPMGYKTLNAVMGALSSAQQEFYRRVAVPYEEIKIKENGDLKEWWFNVQYIRNLNAE